MPNSDDKPSNQAESFKEIRDAIDGAQEVTEDPCAADDYGDHGPPAERGPPGGGAPASGGDKKKRPSKLDQLEEFKEILADVELWHDQENEACASFPVAGHFENLAVASEEFRRWLGYQYYTNTDGDVPSKQALDEAIQVAEGRAIYGGPQYTTYIRIGERGKMRDGDYELWIDLADDQWRAVRVTKDEWSVKEDVPIKFMRPTAARPLLLPQRDGKIEQLANYINVDLASPDFSLIVAWLVAAFRPSGPFPILVVEGPPGSAKTNLCGVLRSLVDPKGLRGAPGGGAPREETDLYVHALNNWVISFDNQSKVHDWLSDAVCRLIQGGGLSRRKLYENKAESWFEAARPVMINGVPNVAKDHSDLNARSIVIRLEPVRKVDSRTEVDLWEDFEAARPELFGAILEALVHGVRSVQHYTKVPVRMADFAAWAQAAWPGFGWKPEDFLRIYGGNQASARDAVLEGNVLAEILIEYMQKKPSVSKTATEWITALSKLVQSKYIDDQKSADRIFKQKGWPDTQNLREKLTRIQNDLATIGLALDLDSRSTDKKRRRLIEIEWRRDT